MILLLLLLMLPNYYNCDNKLLPLLWLPSISVYYKLDLANKVKCKRVLKYITLILS